MHKTMDHKFMKKTFVEREEINKGCYYCGMGLYRIYTLHHLTSYKFKYTVIYMFRI